MNNKMNYRSTVIPAARKQGLVVKKVGNETLVYDTGTSDAHCLNENAAAIWELCDGVTTVNDLSQLLKSRNPGTTSEQCERLVWTALEQLEESRLLDGPILKPDNIKQLSRRQLMKAAAVVGLVAVPVISTIIAPKAAEASTCLASGDTCSISAQCCSLTCTGNLCI
ncbi:MAG TPA: PqqD family protein [Blastocatellia bacterium]|nr:PqqD family protein [Blastocatellia bacterium]